MLHIRCGDDILPKLKAADLPGRAVRWADPLCEGPTPGWLRPEAFRAVRANYLAQRFGQDEGDVLSFLREQDLDLERVAGQDEVVLWFEHDLFDQIILVHLLDRLRPEAAQGVRLSLICIGEHPAVSRFIGLGQLAPRQLAELFAARRPVGRPEFSLAVKAWAAFSARDPMGLERLLATDTSALPYLAAALMRHMQQFPWRAEGLSLTEWQILDLVDLGAITPRQVFEQIQLREPAPWQGDTMVYAWIRELAQDPHALLERDGADWPDGVTLYLTDRAQAVLLGRIDACDGRTLDRWVGGVHVAPGHPEWRWDMSNERLIAMNTGT